MAKLPNIDKTDEQILLLLKDNLSGLTSGNITKVLNIKGRTLYNHLDKLKKLELLENIFPIWRLCHNQISSPLLAKKSNNLKIQTHKISFVLKLIRKPDWWQNRHNRLMTLKGFDYGGKVDWSNNRYTQLKSNQFLIHLFPDTIYFINQKKYFNSDPYLAIQEALEDTIEVLHRLEEAIHFKLFYDEVPQFQIKTNHFVKLNDEIANQCKKDNNMLRVEIDGKLRAWVDMSQPFGLETGNKDYGVEDMNKYKKVVEYYLKKDSFTPEQMQEALGKLLQVELMTRENMIMLDKNMVTHMGLMKGIGNGINILGSELKGMSKEFRKLNKEVFNLKQENIKLKKKINGQKEILDYF